MRNLLQRVVTGIVYVAVLVAAVFLNQWAFFGIFLLAMSATLFEYLRLFKKDKTLKPYDKAIVLASVVLFSNTFFIHFNNFNPNLWLILVGPLAWFVMDVKSKKACKKDWTRSLLGLVYVGIPFVLLQFLVLNGNGFNGLQLFFVFLFIWASDSFAYVFGVTLGRHRIWPSVSPKKSWEGSIGGLLSVLAICFGIWKWAGLEYSLSFWLGFGLVVVVSSTFGDFYESYLKRTVGVKDSGNILPGHGGFLDRFDSALFAIPASVVYLQLVQII